MPDLLGIIVPLRKFLSNSKENITLINPDESILILEKERSYIIPDFQREIRWNEDNVGLLLDDLSAGPEVSWEHYPDPTQIKLFFNY